MIKHFITLLLVVAMQLSSSGQTKQPNILILFADDMGYSDIGCFGSEIPTPNLDALSADGVRFTQFYNSARCCPSRAALLTGKHPHEAGVGKMVDKKGKKDGPYQGYLSDKTPTLAEVLKTAGYQTGMTGKWHVGEEQPHWPNQRGFDWYFGLISGATSYYEVLPKRKMVYNNEPYTPAEGFFMTDAIADSSVSFISRAATDAKPFLCYTAFTAPHWPLHAPENLITKHRNKYLAGWDNLREERLRRQKELGILPQSQTLSQRLELVKPWTEEANKEAEAEKMAVYAAMIEQMDMGIGRIVNRLKQLNLYNNTIIIFLSDNGGCGEVLDNRLEWDIQKPSQMEIARKLPPGPKGSYVAYGNPWANVSNTPFRWVKSRIHEGGISTPFVIKHVNNAEKGKIENKQAFITDLMPHILQAAKAKYPATWNGHATQPLEGQPLQIRKNDVKGQFQTPYGWEHFGNKGLRNKNWKIVALKEDGPWELYNIDEDRIESNNLAAAKSEKLKEMVALWDAWAKKVRVFEE